MNEKQSPVFYDPYNKRWKYFKQTLRITGFLLSALFGLAIFSILINPVLPVIGLPQFKSLPHRKNISLGKPSPNYRVHIFQKEKKKLVEMVRDESSHLKTRKKEHDEKVIGFYVNWDDASLSSLKHNISKLDMLIPEWLHLKDSHGSVSIDDPVRQLETTRFINKYENNFVNNIQKNFITNSKTEIVNKPEKLQILPIINNYNNKNQDWDIEMLKGLLSTPQYRKTAIDNILNFILSNHFAGVNIDFESLLPESRADMRQFMAELSEKFHKNGLLVSQSVPFDDPAFDYKALDKYNDFLILMAYDEHWSTASPGPVASQEWFEEKLEKRFKELSPEKTVIAIGNYGYDWDTTKKEGTSVSFQEALTTASESEGKINFDPTYLNPFFDYYDDNNHLHHLWFLDAVTAFNQAIASLPYQPYGFAIWRLGSEDPTIWNIFDNDINTPLNSSGVGKIRRLHYDYDLVYEGKGEILKVGATPRDGERLPEYDKDIGLIINESFPTLPSPYIIKRTGKSNNKVALTFDDGPDPVFTPQILDILKQYKVHATFFIIGWNAEANQGLLQRIIAEGHEIGNHTFTHPNISTISLDQLKLEINTTDRLLESITGRRSTLFRPPYAEDLEPNTPAQAKPLNFVGSLGYYTIGMQIDPNDWAMPGVKTIVDNTLKGINEGSGNVILLHDSGGERFQTVAALPQIIEEIRKKGNELVTVSGLMGVSRDVIMPPISPNEKLLIDVDDMAFISINIVRNFLYYFFIFGIILGLFRFLIIGTLAILSKHLEKKEIFSPAYLPKVCVIVPAFNEEKVICNTISSLLKSTYPHFEIIVVDDGSKDNTFSVVKSQYGSQPLVKAFRKENSGKSEAVNFGLRQTEAEIILCMDADTIFHDEAISRLVKHFSNPKVGAVAGNIKIGNRVNLLTVFQSIEYITSQNLDRRAFDFLNCITVVPGAIGAWRRDLILQLGGFPSDTLAEDADLTITILKMGYRIEYEAGAIALTEAPDSLKAFLKQRFRWMFGTLQVTWKHRKIMFRKRFGALGLFALPNIFLFQTIFPFISPVMDFFMLESLVEAIINKIQHPVQYRSDNLQHILFYYALFLAFDFFTSMLAFILEKEENWGLLGWLFVQRFFYRQIMYYIGMRSALAAIRGQLVGWNKLERKGMPAVK